MGLIIIIPIYLLKDIIIGVIYGSYYQNYSNIFVIIAISIIFNFQSWIFDTTLMAFKVYKLQLIASIINFIVSIFSSIVLIKSYGLMGQLYQ